MIIFDYTRPQIVMKHFRNLFHVSSSTEPTSDLRTMLKLDMKVRPFSTAASIIESELCTAYSVLSFSIKLFSLDSGRAVYIFVFVIVLFSTPSTALTPFAAARSGDSVRVRVQNVAFSQTLLFISLLCHSDAFG